MVYKYIMPLENNSVKQGALLRDYSNSGNFLTGLRISIEELHDVDFPRGNSTVQVPFTIILYFQKANKGKICINLKRITKSLLSFILEVDYYRYLGKRILFIENLQNEFDPGLLKAEFKLMGIRDIEIVSVNNQNKSGSNFLSNTDSKNGSNSLNKIKWVVLKDRPIDFFENKEDLINADGKTVHDELQILKEENFFLKNKTTVLEKNVYDLNNYYRFVRGETTFRYNNRPKETDSETGVLQPVQLTDLVNAAPPHPINNRSLTYYKQVYEGLPWVYKKIGVLLKIITGRTGFLYFINKTQKKYFLNLLQLLPEERRVEAWYFFEYEILPDWYKALGKRIGKKKVK